MSAGQLSFYKYLDLDIIHCVQYALLFILTEYFVAITVCITIWNACD